jgi:hypothetical protein
MAPSAYPVPSRDTNLHKDIRGYGLSDAQLINIALDVHTDIRGLMSSPIRSDPLRSSNLAPRRLEIATPGSPLAFPDAAFSPCAARCCCGFVETSAQRFFCLLPMVAIPFSSR